MVDPPAVDLRWSPTDFARHFVVRVTTERGVGTGVLLGPRLVATCHHVVADELATDDDGIEPSPPYLVEVSRDDRPSPASVWTHRKGVRDDVALLTLSEPLGPDPGPYPALARGVTDEIVQRLTPLLGYGSGALHSCGFDGPSFGIATVGIGGRETDQTGTVLWYQLEQGQMQGRSGGPVWLMPTSLGLLDGPGIILGLVAQGANRPNSGGTPHSFAATSDAVLRLYDRLKAEGHGLSPVHAIDASTMLASWEPGHSSAGVPRSPSLAELERYAHYATERHGNFSLVGFDRRLRVAIQLKELYVPLDVVLDHGGGRRMVFSSAHHADQRADVDLGRERISLASAFTRARQVGQRGLVLLGDPGSGKTTLLKRMLRQLIDADPEAVGLPADTVPVFLPLRRLSPGMTVEQLMENELVTHGSRLPKGFSTRLLHRGRLLFLLDGLDEVPDTQERGRIARWLEELWADHVDCWFLVTSRYAGYTRDVRLDRNFLEIHMRPMNDEQIIAFVTNWFRVVEEAEAKLDGATTKQDPSLLLEALGSRDIRGEAKIFEMTRNPLLLTAFCLVFRRRQGALPRQKTALFEECIQVLLEGWRKEGKRLPVGLPGESAQEVLQRVALWMHTKEERVQASEAELAAPVAEGLASIGRSDISPSTVLRQIRDESGLLTGWGPDRYGFMHLGFQEFLVAHALRREGLSNANTFESLANRFGSSWWQEAILLMLGLPPPSVFTDFMRAVVRHPDFIEWSCSEMMDLCLREATESPAAPFVELLLASSGIGEGCEQRQLAALQLLERAVPEALPRVAPHLDSHPSSLVRHWWGRQRETRYESLRSIKGGIELVHIPGGRAVISSRNVDNGQHGSETASLGIEVVDFYLARFPVTNRQFREYLRATSAKEPEYWADRRYNNDDQPVVGVSWCEAMDFCDWAGLMLPTEAQWEYACRAGTRSRYSFGENTDDLDRFAWYGGNSGGRPRPVAQKEANAFGLHDMHGNVNEWCADAWNSRDQDAERAAEMAADVSQEPYRVVRGGCWYDPAVGVRADRRSPRHPEDRDSDIGFRPCRLLAQPTTGKSPVG